ncbi:MAG: prephenate dehydrogenase [Acidimicrobiaceae bacterium]|jgi:prephenate dehydrogenase
MTVQRANVIGTGLIGGSIGLALRGLGWHVSGTDADLSRAERARELGALDEVGLDPSASITFVAVPVRSIPDAARQALDATTGYVTDVGSVKGSVLEAVDDPRFVGGHPMAGSEQDGIEGADAEVFEGAVWVLTPTASTDDEAFAMIRSTVTAFGADVVALSPDRHDALVAVVSHVPHLTAATLMHLADERADEHRALLRLAAGGFRDMTRIAAGHPGIWPDICAENRTAIVEMLDRLISGLTDMRDIVDKADREGLLNVLERAHIARRNLPARIARPDELCEVRVPVPDRAGVLADVTTLAAELDVSIADLEIAHSSEGDRGVLILLVPAERAERFHGGLVARGYRPAVRTLE